MKNTYPNHEAPDLVVSKRDFVIIAITGILVISKVVFPPVSPFNMDGRDLLVYLLLAGLIASVYLQTKGAIVQYYQKQAQPYLDAGEPFAMIDTKGRVCACSESALEMLPDNNLHMAFGCVVLQDSK